MDRESNRARRWRFKKDYDSGERVQGYSGSRRSLGRKTVPAWWRPSKPRYASVKEKINVVPISGNAQRSTPNVQRPTNRGSRLANHELPFSTGWHCAHCDSRHSPAFTGLFSFNSPLGACPECRGFGRTIAIDLNKAIPNRSLSIKQAWCAFFAAAEFGESQKKDLASSLRPQRDRYQCSIRRITEGPTGTFVIEGEKRAGDYTDEDYENDRVVWRPRILPLAREQDLQDACARFCSGRYRAYITCPKCNGGRYQPEALNYKIVVALDDRSDSARKTLQLTLPEFQALSILDARNFLTAIEIPSNDSTGREC